MPPRLECSVGNGTTAGKDIYKTLEGGRNSATTCAAIAFFDPW